MSKYLHIDKGLDLLIEINAIDRWSYQIPTNTYTVDGELRNVDGINHKIYDADKLSNLEGGGLYAQIIADFNVMRMEEDVDEVKGYFYKVKNKLKKLNNSIIDYETWHGFDNPEDEVKRKKEQYEAYQLLEKLMDEGKISKQDMIRCNELWKKYK
jgi:hypothetical protein|tara:strand:- start:567 stop:1031 length:465 start_codon:yes stop_codon:yes gene_type:complete